MHDVPVVSSEFVITSSSSSSAAAAGSTIAGRMSTRHHKLGIAHNSFFIRLSSIHTANVINTTRPIGPIYATVDDANYHINYR